MKQRCCYNKHPKYRYYGGKGISVCERWMKFTNFLEDMGYRPDKMTLDRIDNSKGYYKENCRWATYGEQAENTSRNVIVGFAGKLVKRVALAREMGINSQLLGKRIDNGWDEKDFADGKKHLNTGIMQGNEKNFAEEKKRLMDIFKRSASTLSTYLSILDEREKEIIMMRFGLSNGKRMTLEEIGKVEGCTRERVRQIESRCIEKMLSFYYDLSR